MLRAIYVVILLLSFVVLAEAQTFYGTTNLKLFRDGRDKEFRNKAESPLKDTDFANFKGLNYFAINENFRVQAKFTRTSDEKFFQMPTSSGVAKKFVKYGVINFKIAGKPQRLNVYQADSDILAKFPEYADLLFIPFKDLTSGKETYGVGRYLDIRIPKQTRMTLDFNLAYNPNCAYGSEKYSCPIPPKDNFLTVEIKSGERSFAHPIRRTKK